MNRFPQDLRIIKTFSYARIKGNNIVRLTIPFVGSFEMPEKTFASLHIRLHSEKWSKEKILEETGIPALPVYLPKSNRPLKIKSIY